MNQISLVVATVGREEPLVRLLESLVKQIRLADEIIIVDQNLDDRVEKIVSSYSSLPISIVKLSPQGANVARNFGLECSSGNIVGFPDDDCWYPEDVLYKVDHEFKAADIKFISGKILTESSGVSAGRWQSSASIINYDNIWTTTIEAASFFRRESIQSVGGFDINIGPGTKGIYGAHEIDELCTRLLKKGYKGMYNPLLLIGHDEPVSVYDIKTLNRGFRYGAGLGYVIRKHDYSPLVILNFLARSLGGAFINLVRRKNGVAKFYLAVFLGRFYGWLFYGLTISNDNNE